MEFDWCYALQKTRAHRSCRKQKPCRSRETRKSLDIKSEECDETGEVLLGRWTRRHAKRVPRHSKSTVIQIPGPDNRHHAFVPTTNIEDGCDVFREQPQDQPPNDAVTGPPRVAGVLCHTEVYEVTR